MAEAYSWEVREQAQEYYVIEGHTYDEVAGLTGVSVSQLKRWGAEEGWSEAKREYRRALTDIKRKRVKLRAKLVNKALNSLDPQAIYAYAAIEKVAVKDKSTTQAPVSMPVDMHFDTPADAVAALDAAVQRKVGELVSVSGSLDLAAIKNMKQALELLEQMKSKYSPEEEKVAAGGLSDEAADDIKRKILGIS